MSGISAVNGSVATMNIAANRVSAGSEEAKESQIERAKEAAAKKPAAPPPTASSGNNVNMLA